jgi:hypothetical protein
MNPSIYDSPKAKGISIADLIAIYKRLGVQRLIYKELSPNDNSKNQPYLAGHLTDLGFLPTGSIQKSKSTSRKTTDAKRQVKYTTSLKFYWVSPEGKEYLAPEAKLIYYPQYPEVRLSGFVIRTGFDMGGWMAPEKKGRSKGRVMFFGIHGDGKIFSYLAIPGSRISKELHDYKTVALDGVFKEIELARKKHKGDSKSVLLAELSNIHKKGWIASKRLDREGNLLAYKAQNGGGYTLEAELEIIPNGFAEPDYVGWEIKQFGVGKCHLIDSKILTMMTPEPDAGFYSEKGAEAFVRKYGYKSTTSRDRLDFTGRHFYNEICEKTGLKLIVSGFDLESNTITDSDGYIGIADQRGNLASAWTFPKLIDHWKRKHAKAAYIPSLSKYKSDKLRLYSYCQNIRLFEGTSFNHLLKAIMHSHIYYDPGINLKKASSKKPETKRRSQFRIKSCALFGLYDSQENIDLIDF